MSDPLRAGSRRALLYAVVIALASCSIDAADSFPATEAVERFHSLYNARDFLAIYAAADPAFQAASPQGEYLAFMMAVHRNLGLHKSSVSAGWGVTKGTQGTQVRLSFTSEFAEGTATEHYLYRVSAGKPYLVRYNINSPVFILK